MTDPTEIARLKAQLVALKNVRAGGVNTIRTPEGRSITYRPGAELEAAIQALEADIAALCGTTSKRRRMYRLTQTGNGY